MPPKQRRGKAGKGSSKPTNQDPPADPPADDTTTTGTGAASGAGSGDTSTTVTSAGVTGGSKPPSDVREDIKSGDGDEVDLTLSAPGDEEPGVNDETKETQSDKKDGEEEKYDDEGEEPVQYAPWDSREKMITDPDKPDYRHQQERLRKYEREQEKKSDVTKTNKGTGSGPLGTERSNTVLSTLDLRSPSPIRSQQLPTTNTGTRLVDDLSRSAAARSNQLPRSGSGDSPRGTRSPSTQYQTTEVRGSQRPLTSTKSSSLTRTSSGLPTSSFTTPSKTYSPKNSSINNTPTVSAPPTTPIQRTIIVPPPPKVSNSYL